MEAVPSIDAAWILAGVKDWLTVAEAVEGSQPLVALAVTSRRLDEMTVALADLVRWARQNGSTWEQIGAALGTTRQGAWERFHHLDKGSGPGQAPLGA